MRADAPLSTREQEILASVVRAYIETGGPVASRTVARRRRDGLSPASIRNTMADLADAGYLSQPHTSAGRIPTEKAFRAFVGGLAARASDVEAGRLRAALEDVYTVEDRVERCSHLLSEVTRNVGIAFAMPGGGQELEQIELVPLADRRVLMILVTRDRIVRDRVLALDEPVTADELVSIRNYVNRNFAGWKLSDARRELIHRMEADRALYDATLRKLELLYNKGLLEADLTPEVHMEGIFNLLGLDLHLTREKMRDLMSALEEKKRLIDLLDRFLEQPSELSIQVGLQEAHPAMGELALIGITFWMPGGISTKVAVLGPMRMHYERVISAVVNMRRALESV